MKMTDVKIEKQFWAIMVIIFIFVLAMVGISLYQSHKLWEQTQNLYDHPLKVSRALGQIKSDILVLDKDLEAFLQAPGLQVQNRLLASMQDAQKDIRKQIGILKKFYLGPVSDIRNIENEYKNLKVVTGQVVTTARAGNGSKAREMFGLFNKKVFRSTGFLQDIGAIEHVARQKATEFYQHARQNKDLLIKQMFLVAVLLFILLLSGVLFIYHHAIRVPLNKLTRATRRFSEGNYNVRVDYSSQNEMGLLAAAFNNMVSAIQHQIEREDKALHFNSAIFQREDLPSFTQNLLVELMAMTRSQTGAVYLLGEDKKEFVLIKSIGLSRETPAKFSAGEKEGEFGLSLVSGNISFIKKIPEDTRFVLKTTTGKFLPKEIITIPIREKDNTAAVISLASIHEYTSSDKKVLYDIYPSLTARFNGVLLFKRIKEQAQQLEKQNTELEIQGKELSTQSFELSRQNTELKMQKNQLDEANRLKSTFLSNMSHELRTPLNSVIALSSVLKKKLKNNIPEEEYSYIDVIERNGKQLLELINDVLDISRIESGRLEIETSEIHIDELIRGMVTLIEPQARQKNIRLFAKTEKDLPTLTSDGNKIRHILQNLIGNAVKFTEKGEVKVSAFVRNDYLHIRVKDTGIGIAEDQLPFIFDEFRQVDSSTSRKYGGTGLGLSIAKKYAHMLGGTIEVRSKPGQGSEFTLLLPLKPVAGQPLLYAPSPPVVARKPVPRPSGIPAEKTLLIVEDSEPAIVQLKDILTETGFQVMVARNGRQALVQIAKKLPDAMILDLMMPDMDGFQVLDAVRANMETAELPVLILTAKHLEGKDLKRLQNDHVYQMLQKGDINREQLLRLVGEMVFSKTKSPLPPDKGPTPKQHEKIKLKPGQKPLVLIVEDNVDNLLAIKTLLGDRYRILEAYDGQDGVVKAKTYQPDLILMDIAMPVMNGFRAFDAIRKEENLKNTPVIAVTASALTADRQEILHYGFDGYISKPIDIQNFENILQRFFGK